jgi:hypothetical protein
MFHTSGLLLSIASRLVAIADLSNPLINCALISKPKPTQHEERSRVRTSPPAYSVACANPAHLHTRKIAVLVLVRACTLTVAAARTDAR